MTKNIEAIKKIIEELGQRFQGISEFFGDEYDFGVLGHQLSFLDSISSPDPLAPFSLSTEIAIALIETGLFEIRIHAEKETWNPLNETLDSFKTRHPVLRSYQDSRSSPGLVDVKEWVDGFFKD